MLELKDFVAETLKQVLDGVAEAQKHSSEIDAYVNPRLTGVVRERLQNIEFDVAIATTKGDKGQAEGTLNLGVFVASSGIGSKGESSTISRIKFTVPVAYPVQALR